MVYAAVVDDVLGLTLLGVVLAIASTGIIPEIASVLSTTVLTLSLWIALLLGSVYFLPKFLDFVTNLTGELKLTEDSEKHPQSPSTIETLAIFIILVWGAIAVYMGLSPIVGTFAAGILMLAPVCGFLPVVAFLLETKKVPKPTSLTSPPLFNVEVIDSKTESTAFALSDLLRPVLSET